MTRGQDGGHQESVKDSWKEGERRGRLQLHLQEVWSCLRETMQKEFLEHLVRIFRYCKHMLTLFQKDDLLL